jgi:hypothetical protein
LRRRWQQQVSGPPDWTGLISGGSSSGNSEVYKFFGRGFLLRCCAKNFISCFLWRLGDSAFGMSTEPLVDLASWLNTLSKAYVELAWTAFARK